MEAKMELNEEAFARWLSEYIERHNMTQGEFAALTRDVGGKGGLSASLLSAWLTQKVLPEELTRLQAITQTSERLHDPVSLFKLVAILTGEKYTYEAETATLRNELAQARATIAALQAR